MSDKCDHPTEGGDGPPCQHPVTDDGDPDRCWLPQHNDADTNNPQPGRPSEYTEDKARAAIEAARQSKSKAGCARAAGIDNTTLDYWLTECEHTVSDPESGQQRDFSQAFADARKDGETVLVQGGLRNDNVDTSMAKFLLSTSYGYVKTEKREVENTGDTPLSEVVIDFEDVDT
jgi:transposase-like protein